jgi:hypothetical protein
MYKRHLVFSEMEEVSQHILTKNMVFDPVPSLTSFCHEAQMLHVHLFLMGLFMSNMPLQLDACFQSHFSYLQATCAAQSNLRLIVSFVEFAFLYRIVKGIRICNRKNCFSWQI